jgi:hypothetical protein
MKKVKLRYPKRDSIEFDGKSGTYIHICYMAGRIRFQNNSGDVFYCNSYKDAQTISRFLDKISKYLKQERLMK